jgi:hypothetical protein
MKRVVSSIQILYNVWRNRRDPVGYARSLGVQIGANCRLISPKLGTFGSEPYLIKLGHHVTVANGARFVTHDGGVWVFRESCPTMDVFGPITVGNNVFIGANAILMPGVTIGDNCVIGAGAIVTRDIPSGNVAVGTPARCIKTIDQYYETVREKALYIRHLPGEEKKKVLLEHFYWSQDEHGRPGNEAY